MVARLWWKEARTFWPIWVFLIGLALATQFLLLQFVAGDHLRTGFLALLALGWTCFYGFAVAAATFAGERENRTLDLLDHLPMDRWRLWATKSSFALLTTIALGLVLLSLAAAGSSKLDFSPLGVRWAIFLGAVIVLEVLGWGLFWSAFLSNALAAAALAVCAASLSVPLIDSGFNLARQYGDEWPIELALALVTTIASAVLFVWLGPPKHSLVPRRLARATARAKASRESLAEVRPKTASGRYAIASLAWQSIRQVGKVWWWIVLLSLFVPASLYFWTNGRASGDPAQWVLFQIGIAIVAGVGIFGSENPSRSYKFLAHHGVRPSAVWLVRMAVWGVALGALFALASVGLLFSAGGPRTSYLALGSIWFLCLAVSALFGMIIRRSITAGMVSLMAILALTIPGSTLAYMGMMPEWVMVIGPLLLLALSFLWTGEWMLDRPGAGKWLKLGASLIVLFGGLFAGYVTDRVTSVPELDPARDARLFTIRTSATIPANENAAELYRQAGRAASPAPAEVYKAVTKAWDPASKEVAAWARDNAKVLDLLRQASMKPYCQLEPVEKLTFFTPVQHLPSLGPLSALVVLAAREKMARGDLDGVWSDLVVLFRMAHHWSGAVPMNQGWTGLWTEKQALELAMVWAADAKQTADRLRAALQAYRELPRSDAADPVRVEAMIIENTAKLPRSELAQNVLRLRTEPRNDPTWMDSFWTDMVTTPWELARARRACRLLFASDIAAATREPWQTASENSGTAGHWTKLPITDSSTGPILAPAALQEILETTPLVHTTLPATENYIQSWWRNEAGRRALVQILALRIWQVTHGDLLPDQLPQLASDGLLDVLPTDPFTPSRHFGYVRSSGQNLLPLGELDPVNELQEKRKTRPVENSWLLYSVGPDGKDDRAEKNDSQGGFGDIVFPLADKGGQAKPKQ